MIVKADIQTRPFVPDVQASGAHDDVVAVIEEYLTSRLECVDRDEGEYRLPYQRFTLDATNAEMVPGGRYKTVLNSPREWWGTAEVQVVIRLVGVREFGRRLVVELEAEGVA